MVEYVSDTYVSITDDGKVKKKVVKEGFGGIPSAGQYVRVHYTGMLDDGSIFDSSRNRGIAFTFQLGQGEVIKGWDICLATMRQGERCVVEIHPDYGYKDKNVGKIKPNSTLNFEIELLGWTSSSPSFLRTTVIYISLFIGALTLLLGYIMYLKSHPSRRH